MLCCDSLQGLVEEKKEKHKNRNGRLRVLPFVPYACGEMKEGESLTSDCWRLARGMI